MTCCAHSDSKLHLQVCVHRVQSPQLHGPGEALVKVSLAGLCGSDLHPYEGREVGLDAGTTMGHEFTGRIIQVRRHRSRHKYLGSLPRHQGSVDQVGCMDISRYCQVPLHLCKPFSCAEGEQRRKGSVQGPASGVSVHGELQQVLVLHAAAHVPLLAP